MVDLLVSDIVQALKARLYTVALVTTLTLPDICGGIEFGKHMPVGKRYLEWLDMYWEPFWGTMYATLRPAHVYKLRCQLLHLGEVDITGSNEGRILISVLDQNGIHKIWPENTSEPGHLDHIISLPTFCNLMIKSVRCWQEDFSD